MLSAVAPMIQPLHRQLLYRRKPSLSNKVIRFFFVVPVNCLSSVSPSTMSQLFLSFLSRLSATSTNSSTLSYVDFDNFGRQKNKFEMIPSYSSSWFAIVHCLLMFIVPNCFGCSLYWFLSALVNRCSGPSCYSSYLFILVLIKSSSSSML